MTGQHPISDPAALVPPWANGGTEARAARSPASLDEPAESPEPVEPVKPLAEIAGGAPPGIEEIPGAPSGRTGLMRRLLHAWADAWTTAHAGRQRHADRWLTR